MKPDASEYHSSYAGYVSLVEEDDIITGLDHHGEQFQFFLANLTAEQGGFRYQPGKWSAKEVVGHVIDAERIFACRALRISRNDLTPLPGFDQDLFVPHAGHDLCTLPDLIEEFGFVRRASVLLLKHLPAEAWLRVGTASGYRVSVNALAYIILGHQLHHQKILRERYT